MNEQTKQVKWRTVGIAVAAVAAVALGGTWAANAAGVFERPAPEPTAVVQEEPTPTITPSATPIPTPTPTVAPVVEAPPVVEEEPAGPTLCPDGWFPNSVDEYGNESDCAEGNDEGQPCVAYDDNNNCTAYYKP